jgi:hypothetical protein
VSVGGFGYESGATPEWIPETLELDRVLLDNVTERTEEWGRALAQPRGEPTGAATETTLYEAASLMTIAGSYWMLVDARRASSVLREAADLYLRLGNRFAHAVAICGADTRVAYGALEERSTPLSPSSRAYVMLALGWLECVSPDVQAAAREGIDAHTRAAEPTATQPVGRIGLPLDAIVRVVGAAEALLDHGSDAMPSLRGALHDYLVRADDIGRAARADSFHWRNLLSSVLPVEPESTAVGAIVVAAAMHHRMEDEVASSIDLPPAATIPVQMGLAVASAARDERM